MAHAEHTVNINASAEKVFNFVSNAENNPKWRDAVISIRLLSGEAGKQGAIYQQFLKGPVGRAIDGSYRISRTEPGQLLEFEVVAGPARPRGKFVLTPVGSGTQLTFSLDLVAHGLIMKLMEGAIQKTMNTEVANLDKLKQLIEAGE